MTDYIIAKSPKKQWKLYKYLLAIFFRFKAKLIHYYNSIL